MPAGINRLQVHPLIRFLLRSQVVDDIYIHYKAIHLCVCGKLFLVSVSTAQYSSVPAVILLGASAERAVFPQRANHGRFASFSRCHYLRVLLDALISCPRLTVTSVVFSVSVIQHAEVALMDDSCVCCGRMSMASLRLNIRMELTTPPSPEHLRLDDWFLCATQLTTASCCGSFLLGGA